MSNCLLISCPSGYEEERQYVFKVMFSEFLGLCYEYRTVPGKEVLIQISGSSSAGTIVWPDVFFQTPHKEWFTLASLPKSPLDVWKVHQDLPEAKVSASTIPIIYGKSLENGSWFEHKGDTVRLGLDIAGSIFFMLTRYEELVLSERDEHGRFSARTSLAYREGFLERPIVDEYMEILWICMQLLWPGIQRKERTYQLCLSHDVDQPLSIDKPWFKVIRSVGGDLLKRKDLDLAYRRIKAKASGKYELDPLNTFDFIMDVSERYGLKSAFYFKTGVSNNQFDETYNLDSPSMHTLLQRIHKRGHEIGFHPSYDTYNDSMRMLREFKALLQVVEKLNITQEKWGGRQHFLRWENPTTWQIWEDIGLDYDTTLGFADHIGFRCGTCHEFSVFNLKTKKTLRLRERPLIVMDTTVSDKKYMALQPESILERITNLSHLCRKFRGTFTLLWHNTSLIQRWQGKLYLAIINALL